MSKGAINYWIITDTHFGHDKLWKEDIRIQGFEEMIINNISQTVEPEDNSILIHLGDICIGNEVFWNEEFLKLKPTVKKFLVLGNHDNKSIKWYYDKGWDFVCYSFTIKMFGHSILFSHRPIKNNEYDINVHGHCHSDHRKKECEHLINGKQYLVALENSEYKPLNLESVVFNFNT